MTTRTIFGKHYAIAVVAIVFTALLAAAGLRSTPGVLMVPWGQAFGWSRGAISFAVAVGIFLFGLTGPFAAAAMQRFGVRVTVMTALALMSLSSLASLWMTEAWQLVLSWGVVSGIASGCITGVLAMARTKDRLVYGAQLWRQLQPWERTIRIHEHRIARAATVKLNQPVLRSASCRCVSA